MHARITRMIVSLIALITFAIVGAQIVGDFQTWECHCTHVECKWCDGGFTWDEFHADALAEYADEFTRLFEATEVKWSKNNRLMVKGANSASFKFAKR